MSGTETEGLLGPAAEAPKAKPAESHLAVAGEARDSELYHELDSEIDQLPWWKANFLITTQRVTFGTWDGVFTSCVLNIFGTLVFLRAGWLVGEAGVPLALLACCLTAGIGLLTALSAVGVCERCGVEAGGVHSLLGRVLGDKFGAAIGLVYCVGQAVGVSLCTAGLGESVASLFSLTSEWAARGFAVLLTASLLAFSGAGVKWVIRLQLILLGIVLLAVLDFVIGSAVRTNPSSGVLGYGRGALGNNTMAEFQANENFLTVFGVFFPTITGVLAGVNMAGDLADPRASIPVGTVSAIGTSFLLYVTFVVVLGATCTRSALQADYLIGQRVALLGPLFLCGLYVSSLSSALGGLTASSRVLAAVAQSTQLPGLGRLAALKFRAQVPIFSLVSIAAVTLAFNLVGNLNILAPIVAMPFLATYAAVCYAHFALAMSLDCAKAAATSQPAGDLEHLFPEMDETPGRCDEPAAPSPGDSPWARLYNRWLSLFGSLACLAVMFAINWIYALVTWALVAGLHLYVGHFCPGASPGVASGFSVLGRLKARLFGDGRRGGAVGSLKDRLVVVPASSKATPPKPRIEGALLTEENEDYADRGKFHQSRRLEAGLVPGDLE